MDRNWVWVGLTLVLLALYEALLLWRQRQRVLAPSRHAGLREEWFRIVSAQQGSEVLAVQTLRNSMMSATLLASTAALALMGTVTLAVPSLRESVDLARGVAGVAPRQVLELALLALLLASLVAAMMAVRLFNHAGFIGGMPVGSPARARWTGAGVRYVRRAGLLYGVGLRQLVLVVPIVATLLAPLAGPVVAVLVVALLGRLDRFDDADATA